MKRTDSEVYSYTGVLGVFEHAVKEAAATKIIVDKKALDATQSLIKAQNLVTQLTNEIASDQQLFTQKIHAQSIISNRPINQDIGQAIKWIKEDIARVQANDEHARLATNKAIVDKQSLANAKNIVSTKNIEVVNANNLVKSANDKVFATNKALVDAKVSIVTEMEQTKVLTLGDKDSGLKSDIMKIQTAEFVDHSGHFNTTDKGQALLKQYGDTFVGGVSNFIEAVQKMDAGIPWGRYIGPNTKAVHLYTGKEPDSTCTDGRAMTASDVANAIPYLKKFNLDYIGIETTSSKEASGVSALMKSGPFTCKVLNLGDYRGITDCEAKDIAGAISSNAFPNLVTLSLGGQVPNTITETGRGLVNKALSNIPHEIIAFWGKNDGGYAATFKDKDDKYLGLTMGSDITNSIIGIANSSMISGVSAGDQFLPSVKEQIITCIKGGSTAAFLAWGPCTTLTNVATPICISTSAFVGCAGGIFSVVTGPAIEIGVDSIFNAFTSHDHGSSGFDVNDTVLSGVTIDNTGNPNDFDASGVNINNF